jgi:LemA protein
MNITLILLAVIVLIVVWLIAMYNGFVRMINRAKEAWADIDVQLKRRYDLIPNLINAVKGYMTHEAGTFEKVTQARANAMQAQNAHDKSEAENVLSDTLKSLFAVSENYPDLKANQNFLDLQNELSDTENKIQSARRFYNSNVRDLNTMVESFPNNIIAGVFKFVKMELFELSDGEEEARKAPEVKF